MSALGLDQLALYLCSVEPHYQLDNEKEKENENEKTRR